MHTCPRRTEDGTDNPNTPWAFPTGTNLDTYDVREEGGLPKCSYCGSVEPNAFLDRLEAGDELGPTDKNYKAYLEHSVGFNKFYYQHLDQPEQRARFIALLNERKVKFGYPGRFTVLPYFLTLQGENNG